MSLVRARACVLVCFARPPSSLRTGRTWTPRASYANQGSEYPPIGARLYAGRRQLEAADRLGLDLYPPASRACCHCSCGLSGGAGWEATARGAAKQELVLGVLAPSPQRGRRVWRLFQAGFPPVPPLQASVEARSLGPSSRAPLSRPPRRYVGPREIRRQSPRQSQIALLPGRPPVPRRASAPAAAERQLRRAGGRRSPRLPGRRAGVPLGRDPGAGRQRGAGQQEDPHHSPAPPAGHPQRRGAQ